MTIKATIKLTPEAQQAIDEATDWLNTPEMQARLAETAREYYEQHLRMLYADYYQQARVSMLRWDLARMRASRPRWWWVYDE